MKRSTSKAFPYRASVLLRILLSVVITLLLTVSAGAENPAMKRGRDWMDLKQYDNARAEFRRAIQEEPKNADARYLIAESYYQEGYLLNSLEWARDTIKVSPNHRKATALLGLIQGRGTQLLLSQDVRSQALGLKIAEGIPGKALVPGLKAAMAGKDEDNAMKAERLLAAIQAGDVRATWTALLTAHDKTVQERAAERSWALYRAPEAVPILRTKYAQRFLSAAGTFGGDVEKAVRQSGEMLLSLGPNDASNVFIDALTMRDRVHIKALNYAVETLVQQKEAKAIPVLIREMEKQAKGDPGNACSGSTLAITWALGRLGGKAGVPAMTTTLSSIVSKMPNYTECIDAVLDALSQADDPAWKRFSYWYKQGGWGEFNKMRMYLKDVKDGRVAHGSSNDPIDATSPNAGRVYEWLANIGPCSVLTGCKKGLDLGWKDSVVVRSPTEVEYLGEVVHDIGSNTYIVKSAYTLTLRATGDPERAWVITDVKERPCTRCEQKY